jgi:alanine dehydrogenase
MDSSTHPTSSIHNKGEIKLLSLSETEVKTCIDLRKLLDALADGFKALSDGLVVNPARPQLDIPNAGYSLAMPAWMKGMHLTIKLVNVFEGNIARGIPSHLATIHLFDPETGMPVCIMDGTYITAVRTSGSAVLSVRELARRNAKVATVVGAGVQAISRKFECSPKILMMRGRWLHVIQVSLPSRTSRPRYALQMLCVSRRTHTSL